MPSYLALLICVVFILWLFVKDRKMRPMTSKAMWVVLAWIVVVATRPVSTWFGAGLQIEAVTDYLDGSPLDRNVYLLLISVGLVLLLSRKIDWGLLVSYNKWAFAFFLYCGISIIWSDYSFVSLKRWIKDIGNVVMIMLILSEERPSQAAKAVFLRSAYIVVPLSMIFIKYFPDIGRIQNPWTWEYSYCGVTTNKNVLGCVLFICAMFLLWDFLDIVKKSKIKITSLDLLSQAVLMVMIIWLLGIAGSSTANACLILGACILFFQQRPFFTRQLRHLRAYALAAGFLVLLTFFIPGIFDFFVGIMGRDMTLTGRTGIWADLLAEPVNKIVGTGFESFWLGPGAQRMWEKYYFHPNQAHNGYLETYLNCGLVGVCLLMSMILSAGRRLKQEVLRGSSFEALRFAFLVTIILYNWTEAMFNKMSIIWFVMLLVVLNYQCPSRLEQARIIRYPSR